MATLSWPARAPKIIRQRSATCCGVPYEDSHFSSSARSAGSNLITRLVFGMSEIIATADKAVKVFKGHYTSKRGFQEPQVLGRTSRGRGEHHITMKKAGRAPEARRCLEFNLEIYRNGGIKIDELF